MVSRGLWKGDGLDLPSKCRENYPFENTVFDYSNVFCYLCNTQDLIYPEETTRIEDIAGVVNDELTDLQPVNYSVFDIYQNVCRPVLCPDGRQLVNGTCKSLFRRFNGYIYTICLKYKITVDRSQLDRYLLTDKFTNEFLVKIAKPVVATTDFFLMQDLKAILSMTPCVNGYLNATMAIGLHLSPSKSLESEDVIIRHIQDTIKMTVGSDDTAPFTILSVEQIPDCLEEDMTEQGADMSCLKYQSQRPPRVFVYHTSLSYLFSAKRVTVSNLLMCVQMVLERLEVDHDSDMGVITILANNKTLTSTEFQLEDAGYLICVEDYIENAKIVQTKGCTARSVSEYAESTSRVAGLGGSIFSCLLLYVMVFFTF
ncbi:hypothetical protein LOTGIDRAFT_158073 [Lottia gigantea]|uniref:Uncharacterized protein n=1 Tax=Lottia gigantea TaxID=225164 RepID=V4AY09_LOTGI|nr:hypothetical protein LOTGIDRAFT_158073 [Lottia gigantea]ESO99915.1 hypothetical protein LOTGIDRAFT_158073 [Lottia gigantea]